MMIANDWMREDYLSIDDVIDMLESFKTEHNGIELRNRVTLTAKNDRIKELEEEIRILKGEAQ